MGPTPTPTRTLGRRLSCNFVNVYSIVYRVQYTYTCARAHRQRTSSSGKARVGQKSADKSAGSWQAERAAHAAAVGLQRRSRQADFRARDTDFCARRTRRLPREDPREEVGEEVRVGVGVRVGPVEFKLIAVCKHASPRRKLACHEGSHSHSVICHPAEVIFPPLPQPIKAGTRFGDTGGMQG